MHLYMGLKKEIYMLYHRLEYLWLFSSTYGIKYTYILYQFVKLFQCKMYKHTQEHQTHATLCKVYSVREQNEQKHQFTVSRLSIVFSVTKSRFRDGASVLQNALRPHSLTAIPTASSLHALSITNVTFTFPFQL